MSDLDSFFAKKDKKKGKKGKKFTTTEEIAKRLETTEKKVEKTTQSVITPESLKRADELTSSLISGEAAVEAAPVTDAPLDVAEEQEPHEVKPQQPPPPTQPEEEQWNDFKDDMQVDVSNLKITKLNIEEEEEGRGGAGGDGGDDGSDGSGDDKKDGVWKIEEKKSIQSTICEAVDSGDTSIADMKATVEQMSANARRNGQQSGEVYVPPSAAARAATGRRKKAAPDVSSSMDFPSLADAQANTGRKKNEDNQGRNILRGAAQHNNNPLAAREAAAGSGAYKPPMLRTTNRYNALNDSMR